MPIFPIDDTPRFYRGVHCGGEMDLPVKPGDVDWENIVGTQATE